MAELTNMKNSLEKYIRLQVDDPSESEIQEILEIFELKIFGNKEFIKRPSTISKQLGFLVKGSVKGTFYKDLLNKAQIIDVENALWGAALALQNEQSYISLWISNRLEFLDKVFND